MSAESPLPVSVSGLDHVVLRVRDLDVAQDLFARLGFSLTPRGFHVGRGSANHTVVFRSGTYIELIQLPGGEASGPFGNREEGPVAVALRPADSRQVHRELGALGFQVDAPRDLARPVDLPDGARDARFVNVSLPDIGLSGLRLFACQHLTPDLVWREEWLDHSNRARGVVRVIVLDPDPQAHGDATRRLFGSGVKQSGDGALLVTLGSERIDILQPDVFERQFPGVQIADVAPSGIVGLTLDVSSVQGTTDVLRNAGIPFTILSGERIVLAPDDTGGTLIEFVDLAIAGRHAADAGDGVVPTLTPPKAWARIQEGSAVLVDVRSPEELAFVGHIPGAVSVPWATGTDLVRNPDFIDDLRATVSPGEHLLFICRSGKRSEHAAKAALEAGFLKVANVIEGFEGDIDSNKRRGRVNGWRFHGLPWAQG